MEEIIYFFAALPIDPETPDQNQTAAELLNETNFNNRFEFFDELQKHGLQPEEIKIWGLNYFAQALNLGHADPANSWFIKVGIYQ